jgi:hypothetical protein
MFVRLKILALFSLTICVLLFGCSRQATEPGEKDINFTFTVEYVDHSSASSLFSYSEVESDKAEHGQRKIANHSLLFNMARVMVLDMSKYDSWTDFQSTDEWDDYRADRDAWTGDRNSWAAWKGFIGNYFPVVADQTLAMDDDHATGNVPGVVGQNRFIMAFTEGDVIEYLGEASAIGIEDEVVEVRIGVERWGN